MCKCADVQMREFENVMILKFEDVRIERHKQTISEIKNKSVQS
jgi:hypothetical protein